MRIDSQLIHLKPSSQKKSKKLGNPEFISDLFNNRKEHHDEESHTKIRLSYTVKAMLKEFEAKTEFFLNKEKKIAKALEKISLPENTYTTIQKHSNLNLRKLSSYLQWLSSYQTPPTKKNTPRSEQPFIEIFNENKNATIKELFSELDQAHKKIQIQRKKNSPNYFYLNYPETYSFN
jgi:hypothetical protein